jgi:serine protease Do
VPVEVLRDGKVKALNVTISKLSEKEVATDEPPAQQGKLGLALRDLRPEERRHLNLQEDEGVGVEGVMPDSPAAEAGIQAGDVILQVNRIAVGSVEEVKKAVHQAGDDRPLLFLLHHADGNNQFVTLAAK